MCMCIFLVFTNVLTTRITSRNKAVADGAISFYLDHSVSVRVSRFAYGTECNTPYRREDPEHKSRSKRIFQGLDGVQRLSDYFSIILPKVCVSYI